MLFTYNKYHHSVYSSVANEITGQINNKYNGVKYYFHLKSTNDSLVKANEALYNKLRQDFEIPDTVNKIAIDTMSEAAFHTEMEEIIDDIKTEYKTLEPNLTIEISKIDTPEKMMDLGVQEGLTRAIYAACNGVYRMSPDIQGLVETSNNIARVIVKDGEITIACLTRSSVETSKWDLANMLRATFELTGCEVAFDGDYPGWKPNMDSNILKVLSELYTKMNGKDAHVAACHAGLECGILGQNYPEMDMISFGPNIKGAHSPDERAQISSAQKYWKFVLEILNNIPKK